jgi:hypothetical protein
MSNPLPASELSALADEMPKPCPDTPDQTVAIARGLGWFARPSEHEYRLQLERRRRDARQA